MSYIICIPSYKRHIICQNKTLTMLKNNNIDSKCIYVYVASQEEYDLYKNSLDETYYNELIIGELGLTHQRQFIQQQFPVNTNIVFFDDDIESVDLSLSPKYSINNLDYFIKDAFSECIINKAFIWGVYPVLNAFFRKTKSELSTDLKYIVGAFYGIINRPDLSSIKLTITNIDGQKEDVERTLKYFIHDGIVLRFNKIGFKTKYYGKEGGLGTFKNRLEPMKNASINLHTIYPQYGNIKVRSNGMTEFVLKKIKSLLVYNALPNEKN